MQSWKTEVLLLPQQECYTTSEKLMNCCTEHTGWFIATQLACKRNHPAALSSRISCLCQTEVQGEVFFPHPQCLQKLW